MRSSWQTETSGLVCRWSDAGKRVQYDSDWMQDANHVQGSYLPPVPNFASHSPFAGASWFKRYTPKWDPA